MYYEKRKEDIKILRKNLSVLGLFGKPFKLTKKLFNNLRQKSTLGRTAPNFTEASTGFQKN